MGFRVRQGDCTCFCAQAIPCVHARVHAVGKVPVTLDVAIRAGVELHMSTAVNFILNVVLSAGVNVVTRAALRLVTSAAVRVVKSVAVRLVTCANVRVVTSAAVRVATRVAMRGLFAAIVNAGSSSSGNLSLRGSLFDR